jgi:hypothetical protein
MKFGRAPAMINSLIPKNSALLGRKATGFRDLLNLIYDLIKGPFGSSFGDGLPQPFLDLYLGVNLFWGSNQNQTTLVTQMAVHGANSPSEDAVNRHSESSCFPIHCPASANH